MRFKAYLRERVHLAKILLGFCIYNMLVPGCDNIPILLLGLAATVAVLAIAGSLTQQRENCTKLAQIIPL